MDRHKPLQLLGGVVFHSGSINEVLDLGTVIWEVAYTCIWSYDKELVVYTWNTLFYCLFPV